MNEEEDVPVPPHVLLPLHVFIDKHSEFIDSLIPELKKNDGAEINLNNVKQLDEILTHLELTFRANYEATYGCTGIYSNLKVPSSDIFRVLLTLASRCRSSNWTDSTTCIDGLQTTNEQVRALNEDYYNSIHKPPLQSRSLLLLQSYLCYFLDQPELKDPTLQLLYGQLASVCGDFIVRNRTVTKASLPSSGSHTIRTVVKQNSSPKPKGDITSYFQSPPKSSPPRLSIKDENANENSNDDVISDSEGNISDFSAVDMEKEVYKFQSYNITPNKKLSRNLLTNDDEQKTSGLNNSEALFSSMSMERKQSSSNRRQRMMSPSKFPSWHSIKIFDDFILSKKLNPKLNRNFNLWQLVNWTFYCADRSTDIQRQSPNSNYSAYHLIYSAHRDTLEFLFDFIAFNFQYELNNDDVIKKAISEGTALASSRAKAAKLIEGSDSILLSKLVTQLGASQRDWYDRAVEYIFNGLGSKSKEPPKSCYDREKGLIAHDHSTKEQFHNFTPHDFVEFNDNRDSMKTRFKIAVLLYYWSTIFHNIKGGSSNFDILGKRELLTQLAFKFVNIDVIYIIQFYSASHSSAPTPTPTYTATKQAFLEELTNILILEITKTVEDNVFVVDDGETDQVDEDFGSQQQDQDKIPVQVRNIYKILESVHDQYIYSAIIEDETYHSFEEFIQQWMKINFLFEWCLNLSFEKYETYIKNCNTVSPRLERHWSSIHSKCKAVDSFRKEIFSGFLIEHSVKDTYHFRLSEDQVHKIQRKNPTMNSFQDIFENRFYMYI